MTLQPSRVQVLNKESVRPGEYVLYWMQQSQRSECNHALEYAVRQANDLKQMLLVAFGLTADYPEANLRHYTFMLEGLAETGSRLAERGIKFTLRLGSPPDIALALSRRASMIVCDRGYLRHQRVWRDRVAKLSGCRVVQVESDVIVPVEVASSKAEYAARTLRPRINRLLPDYLAKLTTSRIETDSTGLDVEGVDYSNIETLLGKLNPDRSVSPVSGFFRGGTSEAKKRFDAFLRRRLKRYEQNSNQPQTDDISQMSPYLHFGQISPLYLAQETIQAPGIPAASREAYLEELIVRRELSMNFAFFTPDYDNYRCIPGWAGKSLADHGRDKRDYLYSRRRLEGAKTHDPYWNACMQEMKHTGFMHNCMRMYWGKKILEWSETPKQAFRTTIALNNKYFLDGRDPNSYTGVAWIYGLHDRPWKERPIFGKIRYMAASGLERKCDITAYVEKVNNLIKTAHRTEAA